MKTTSFELAKRLDELEVKRDSSFSWHYDKNLWPSPVLKYISPISSVFRGVELYAAYTLDEILAMLPPSITHKEHDNYLQIEKYRDNTYCFCYCLEVFYEGIAKECMSKNPAEAAGELLAWCIENGHIDPKKL